MISCGKSKYCLELYCVSAELVVVLSMKNNMLQPQILGHILNDYVVKSGVRSEICEHEDFLPTIPKMCKGSCRDRQSSISEKKYNVFSPPTLSNAIKFQGTLAISPFLI